MMRRLVNWMIGRAERRLGVGLDYVHQIAGAGIGLLMRYNRIFAFLDPRRHSPSDAYHIARIRGALAADCGTCVQAEINLAGNAGVPKDVVNAVLRGDVAALPTSLASVIQLVDAVVRDRIDDADARQAVMDAYGEAGLIELVYAMNGAALLPGIKRGLGHAVACDLSLLRNASADEAS